MTGSFLICLLFFHHEIVGGGLDPVDTHSTSYRSPSSSVTSFVTIDTDNGRTTIAKVHTF